MGKTCTLLDKAYINRCIRSGQESSITAPKLRISDLIQNRKTLLKKALDVRFDFMGYKQFFSGEKVREWIKKCAACT